MFSFISVGEIIGLTFLVIVLVTFCMGIVVCRQQTAVVIERLGKFHFILKPGFHGIIPFIDRKAAVNSLRIVQMDNEVDTKTEDNVFVKTTIAVQY